MSRKSIYLLAALLLCSCQSRNTSSAAKQKSGKQIVVSSQAFRNGDSIPRKYTCDGSNFSPALSWNSIPAGTGSIALIADDPDAPRGVWVHWVLFNLPANTKELPEHIPASPNLSNGAKQGINDSGTIGYSGPCPPSGTHRYYFRVYALDTMLKLDAGVSRSKLDKAMKGHIIGQGWIMGRYSRNK